MKKSGTIKGDNGDYNAVKQLIEEVIIGCNKAVPMIVIYEKFHPPGKYNRDHATKYRSRLKERILSEYGHSLWFLKVDGKSPDIVVSSEGVKSHTILNDKKTVLKQAAMYLREDIESQTGLGVRDSTHIVQFAENSESTKSINLISSMERSKRRSIQHNNVVLLAIHVDKKGDQIV